MSSNAFIQVAQGTSARRAFNAAVRQALYDHGHNGYTGTIAEKSEEGFVIFPFPKGKRKGTSRITLASFHADQLLETEESIGSKYDPAGCIEIAKGRTYLFFGHAQN